MDFGSARKVYEDGLPTGQLQSELLPLALPAQVIGALRWDVCAIRHVPLRDDSDG